MHHSFTSQAPWMVFAPRPHGGRCGPRHMHRRGWGRGMGGGGFGPRARRGDVRSALLLLLEEQPRNGYGLMQEIERRSGGLWRPSPGSVYPALSQLEDEGLVTTVQQDGKRAFTLTDEGRAHVESDRERLGVPWEAGGEHGEGAGALLTSSAQLAMAIQQIGRGGTPEQLEAARRVVDDARRALYRLLAGDEPPAEGDPPREA
jgi:DNA-binding PadR family transcriptional regulator